jgi:hypothetical protein
MCCLWNMNVHQYVVSEKLIISLPVFEGLSHAGISGRGLAKAMGVTPPTVSKWRGGGLRVPDDSLVFMTLMLADRVDDLTESYGGWGPDVPSWLRTAKANLVVAQRCLAAQSEINLALPPIAVRDGSRRFRVWWNGPRAVAVGRVGGVQGESALAYLAGVGS